MLGKKWDDPGTAAASTPTSARDHLATPLGSGVRTQLDVPADHALAYPGAGRHGLATAITALSLRGSVAASRRAGARLDSLSGAPRLGLTDHAAPAATNRDGGGRGTYGGPWPRQWRRAVAAEDVIQPAAPHRCATTGRTGHPVAATMATQPVLSRSLPPPARSACFRPPTRTGRPAESARRTTLPARQHRPSPSTAAESLPPRETDRRPLRRPVTQGDTEFPACQRRTMAALVQPPLPRGLPVGTYVPKKQWASTHGTINAG